MTSNELRLYLNQHKVVAAALAVPDREDDLKREWGTPLIQVGSLFLGPPPAGHLLWAQEQWKSVEAIEFSSISVAAQSLKSRRPYWVNLPHEFHRRAALIQENLKSWNSNPLDFLAAPKSGQGLKPGEKKFATWMLIDEQHALVLYDSRTDFPAGEVQFAENKKGPPSRAYLKLWEALTLHVQPPSDSDRVMDLGSSPGGWTWVLQGLGCEVLSVDKAPLEESIARLKKVTVIKKDAFTLRPDEIDPVDWLFCDIICAPQRLYELVQLWIKSARVRNFLCTIKFKGETDFSMIQKFKEIPGSQLLHLYHNKHELTWILKHPKAQDTTS